MCDVRVCVTEGGEFCNCEAGAEKASLMKALSSIGAVQAPHGTDLSVLLLLLIITEGMGLTHFETSQRRQADTSMFYKIVPTPKVMFLQNRTELVADAVHPAPDQSLFVVSFIIVSLLSPN